MSKLCKSVESNGPMCQSILADCGWLWYFDDLMFDYMIYMLKWPKSIGLKLSNRCWTLLHVSAYSAACCQQQRNSKKTGTNMRGVLSVLPLPRWNLTSSVQSVLPSIIRNGSSLAWEVPWQPQFYWPQFILEYLTSKLLKGPFHVFFCGSGSLCKIINPGKEWTQPAVQYGLIHHHLVLRCRPSLCLNTSQHISTHLNTSSQLAIESWKSWLHWTWC